MKILFVYRGYGSDLSNSVIDFQLNTLKMQEVDIQTFTIRKGRIKGYILESLRLNKMIRVSKVDLIHAHYSFSGFLASLVSSGPVVCSLMGSDLLMMGGLMQLLTRFFSRFLWAVTIVKSAEMKILLPGSHFIPNGVDLDNFRELSKSEALQITGFSPLYKHIIFVAQDPLSKVKNLALAEKAVSLLNDDTIKFHTVSGKSFEELPFYYNSADALVLTSLSEGSPNVIKEAMACNCPIVTTDVGDIREVMGDTRGCYITSSDPHDIAAKLKLAIEYRKNQLYTNGRQRIIELGLDSETIAGRIIEVYKKVLKI